MLQRRGDSQSFFLITGATGLVGGEFFRRLIHWDPQAHVLLCLRSKGGQTASERLTQLVRDCQLTPSQTARVSAQETDLGQAQLGWSPSFYTKVAASVTQIFHFAAHIGFDLSLEEARKSQVVSTHHLVRLAEKALLRPETSFQHFHFISTFATAFLSHTETPASTSSSFRNTYEQTKAEAEQLLLKKKKEASFPVTLYRLSIVCGESQTGWTQQWNSFYLLCRLFLEDWNSFTQLSASQPQPLCLPIPSSSLDIIPLDFAANSLYFFSQHLDRARRYSILHLVAGETALSLSQLLQDLAKHPHFPQKLTFFPSPFSSLEAFSHHFQKAIEAQTGLPSFFSHLFQKVFSHLVPYALDPEPYRRCQFLDAISSCPLLVEQAQQPLSHFLLALTEYAIQTEWGKKSRQRPSLAAQPPFQAPASGLSSFKEWTGNTLVIVARTEGEKEQDPHPLEGKIPPKTFQTMDPFQKKIFFIAHRLLSPFFKSSSPLPPFSKNTGFLLGCQTSQLETDFLGGLKQAWEWLEKQLPAFLPPKLIQSLEPLKGFTLPEMNEDTLAGSLPNVALGRVLHAFDLHGPSCVIQAGEHTEKTVLQFAQGLMQKEGVDQLLIGIVSDQKEFIHFSSLSPTDSPSQPKEKQEIFLLKKFSQAQRDQNEILGFIKPEGTFSFFPQALSPFLLPNQKKKTSSSQKKNSDIAIIGMGCHLPGARDVSEYWDLILSRESALSSLQKTHWKNQWTFEPTEKAGLVFNDPSSESLLSEASLLQLKIPPKDWQNKDPSHFFLYQSLLEALRWNSQKPLILPSKTSFVVGESKSPHCASWKTSLSLLFSALKQKLQNPSFLETHHHSLLWGEERLQIIQRQLGLPEKETQASSLLTTLSQFSRFFGWQEKPQLIDAACASSLAALAVARHQLLSNQQDCVVWGGMGISFHPSSPSPFRACGALSSTDSLPFDQKSNGLILSEGAVTFILKRKEEAEKAGEPIYGIIRSIGYSNDGKDTSSSMTVPSVAGQTRAIQKALQLGKIGPDEVSWIECHATGTPLGDRIEYQSLQEVFAQPSPSKRSLPPPLRIGSVKSQIGHSIGAAGAAGVLKAVLAGIHQTYPPMRIEQAIHADFLTPPIASPKKRRKQRKICIQTCAEPWISNTKTKQIVGVSSFGFGGTHWHTLLEIPALPSSSSVTIHIPQKTGNSPPSIAFFFPGHGAPYPGMGMKFYQTFPVFRRTIQEANPFLKSWFGKTAEALVEEESSFIETDKVQPLLLTFLIAFDRLVKDSGIQPQILCGHSIGEFAAAVSANLISFETGLFLLHQRGKIFRDLQKKGVDTGKMLALRSSEKALQDLLRSFPTLSLACLNTPTQFVVAGPTPTIQQATVYLEKKSLVHYLLPIEVAWHSDLAYKLGREKAKRLFSGVSLQKSQAWLPVLSTISHEFYTPDSPPSFAWVKQLRQPMDFVQYLRNLQKRGPFRGLEMGPRQLLKTFSQEVFTGPGEEALILSSCDIAYQNEKNFSVREWRDFLKKVLFPI